MTSLDSRSIRSCQHPSRWVAAGLALGLCSSGCLVPVPLRAVEIELPGWGIEYRVLEPDGNPHEGGHLLMLYHVEPQLPFVPVRRTRELHLCPIREGVARIPPKQVRKIAWFSGIDAWWGDEDFTESYVLVPGVDPIRSSPPDWYHGFIANVGGPGILYDMTDDSPRIITPETTHEYLFGRPCRLLPVREPSAEHVAFLRRLANADAEFQRYRTFGAEGNEINLLKRFAASELERFGLNE